MLRKLLTGKGIVRAGSGNKKGKVIVRTGSGNKREKGIVKLVQENNGIFNTASFFNKL